MSPAEPATPVAAGATAAMARDAANRANLRARVLSALVLGPAVLGVVWIGGWALTATLLLTAALAAGEWAAMLARDSHVPALVPVHARDPRLTIAAAAGGTVLVCALSMTASPWFLLVAAPIGLGFAALVGADRRSLAFVGIPYLTFGLVAMDALASGEDGRTMIIVLLAVVWATDIGAYAAGRTIGGPKLAPTISPKKTWAGLLGGMAAAAAAGGGVAALGDAPSIGPAALTGAGLAVIAQAGDLFESFVKRRVDVKDSSRLIPGHGGVLDRIDGLLTAAPALAILHALGARLW